jgi:MFS family permease
MPAPLPAPSPTDRGEDLYDADFWLAYIANLALVCANSLTFRFAEFVAALGGTEEISGEIVRAGLIAAILARLGLGRAIDHFGTRRVWLLSGVAFLTACGALTLLAAQGPAPHASQISAVIWLARMGYQVGLAGMFTCSIVHIQNQVPPQHRTEIIGSLGSSGFVGTIFGTQLSDLIFRVLPEGNLRFAAMFGGTLLLGVLHSAIVVRLTRSDRHERPEVTPGPIRLLFRYWPGPIVFVAIAMGTSFAITTVFLTRFATLSGFRGIGLFFLPYSLTAFACRWFLRDWGTTLGRHTMVVWGLLGLNFGQLLFLFVQSDWMFIPPGMVCGFGHALLFPAVVSIGAGRFPVQYRGTGTTLVLGFIEVGTAVAAPLLGSLIDVGNDEGPGIGFSWMFVAASAVAGIVGLMYSESAAHHPDHDLHHHPTPFAPAQTVEAESDVGDLIVVPVEEE